MTTVNQRLFALTLFAALGCGLIAGVFLAFSTFMVPYPLTSCDAEEASRIEVTHVCGTGSISWLTSG